MFLEFTPNVIISFLSRDYVEAAPSAIYPPHKKAQKKVSRTDGRTRPRGRRMNLRKVTTFPLNGNDHLRLWGFR